MLAESLAIRRFESAGGDAQCRGEGFGELRRCLQLRFVAVEGREGPTSHGGVYYHENCVAFGFACGQDFFVVICFPWKGVRPCEGDRETDAVD